MPEFSSLHPDLPPGLVASSPFEPSTLLSLGATSGAESCTEPQVWICLCSQDGFTSILRLFAFCAAHKEPGGAGGC